MRTIGVVTTGRQDYGIYLPILKKIRSDPTLKLHLIVAGMHWLKEYGFTAQEIEKDGFEITAKVEFPSKNDTPEGIAKSMGTAILAFAQNYSEIRPDILLVLGDRFEMNAACLAALPFKIPVGHIHGGEITQGAFDEALRHSITKMSHLHFVATPEYAKRVKQLGEEDWRILVSGAPTLDHLTTMKFVDRTTLEQEFDLCLDQNPVLVTYHPVTLEFERTEWQVTQLLEALGGLDLPIVFTTPNIDTSNSLIRRMIENFCESHPLARFVFNFGPDYYFNMLKISGAMVGNSSSGLIEAPSFELPVVNIGTRERGRVRAKNVIDVGYDCQEIKKGLREALSKEFRESLKGLKNPYGDGKASERIVRCLKEACLDERLLLKKFVDSHGAE